LSIKAVGFGEFGGGDLGEVVGAFIVFEGGDLFAGGDGGVIVREAGGKGALDGAVLVATTVFGEAGDEGAIDELFWVVGIVDEVDDALVCVAGDAKGGGAFIYLDEEAGLKGDWESVRRGDGEIKIRIGVAGDGEDAAGDEVPIEHGVSRAG